MSAVDSSDWLGKLIEQESDEVWLRSGVRILVLLVLIALGGAAIVFVENAATGDVSLITRMASFTFSLFALLAAPVALVCVAIGLVRRYLLKSAVH